ncbi:Sodium/hydrogen exchanger family-domain-containing protein [Russula aff. rugulosa BPL654]|nr:Sodium/hydrogen exchanger family-domain-containing protein [Russula aff. rugulosa BPL654]
MPWEFLDTSATSVAYTLIGGFVVVYNLISLVVKERLYMNEVILGTGFGIILGPHCLGIFDPRSWTHVTDSLTREIMRIVLATGLFAIGVELPKRYMADHAKSLLIMVVPTMAFGWFVSAAFIHLLFPKLDFVSSLVISACLTPTDPIISAAVIGGRFAVKHVPLSIRQLLIAESASNDGLAYPFLSIAVYLTTEASRETAIEKWLVISWLCYLFSRLLRFAHQRGFLDRESYVAQYIALALFTVGATNSLGNDDLLAALLLVRCVLLYLDLVLNCACFIYIGAWLPFNQFNISELGISPWRLLMPEVSNWREALFCGHFGPIGVGAVFISTLAQSRLEAPHNPPSSQQDLLAIALQPIVSFVVLGSIVTHGLSIPFFSVGRRTLTFSRSLRIAAASVNETEREGQNHVDWPRLSDLSDLIPEGANSPRKVLKFRDVCISLFPLPHLTFLIHSA